MRFRIHRAALAAALLAALIFPACGGGGGGGGGGTGDGGGGGGGGGDFPALRVIATDAPFPYDSVVSATVRVQRIELRDAAGAFVTLSDFTSQGGRDLDLVKLRNGTVDILFEGDPAVGSYDLVRIIVGAVEITIDDDGTLKTFTDFKVPSGEQTGLKMFIDPPITVATDLTTDLVLDFDLSGSFVVQGNPNTPAGIKGFHFKPVVRAVNSSTAGSLTFRVTSDNGTPGDTSDDTYLNGAAYEIIDPTDDSVVATGSSGTDPNDPTAEGYVFHPAIPAGGYRIEVGAADHEDFSQGLVITAANLTDLGTIVLPLSPNQVSGAVTTVLTTAGGTDLEFAVPGATVNAFAEGTTVVVETDDTNSAGLYQLTSVTSGTYDLEVTATGYQKATGKATTGGAAGDDVTVDFELVPLTADVSGTVTDNQGTPVVGATVSAIIVYAGQDETIATATTDSNGEYTLSGLATGSYVIRAATAETTPRTGEDTLDHVGGGTAATVDLEVQQ